MNTRGLTVEEARALRLARARRIAALNREGMSDRRIAAELGVALNVVRAALAMPARELRG